MGNNTKIEWTEATWNPVAGCRWASPGCDHCYAARMTRRLEAMGHEKYTGLTTAKHFNGEVYLDKTALQIPLKRKKATTYFVDSMSDLFYEKVSFDFVDKVFAIMSLCPQHTFQVLTKRPERMAEYVKSIDERSNTAEQTQRGKTLHQWAYDSLGQEISRQLIEHARAGWWEWLNRPNVWIGTSVENSDALHRIDELRPVPAAVRFLSLEPLLEDLGPLDLAGIDWVIVGGESGPHARPLHPDWALSIRDQCQAARVPFFFKQWGLWKPVEYEAGHWPESHDRDTFPDGQQLKRVGKQAAGRLLDGREWNEVPK